MVLLVWAICCLAGVLLVMFWGVSGTICWSLLSYTSVLCCYSVRIAAGHWKDGCRRSFSWWNIKGWDGEARTRDDFVFKLQNKKIHLFKELRLVLPYAAVQWLKWNFAIAKTRSRASENAQWNSSWSRPDTAIPSVQLQLQHGGAAPLFWWVSLSLIPRAPGPLNRTLFREEALHCRTMAWLRFMSKPH